jgi:hypothetical protein
MNSENSPKYPELPENHVDNIHAKWKDTNYFPTALSSFQICFDITKETEKAVLCDHEHWFPKSQVMVENGRVIAIKKPFYNRMKKMARRAWGF